MRALRAHRLIVLAITLVALAAAVGWLAHRAPQYQAKAEILVSPLPQDDQTFLGIPDILRDSASDPTRTIQTAATFLDSPLAAQVAARKVGHGYTLDSVQNAVTVEPQGESNILAVTAKVADDKQLAAQVANQFAAAALQVRAQQLRKEIDAQLTQLQARLRGVPSTDTVTRSTIAAQINQLEAANNGKDPTLSLLETARVPSAAVGAPAWLVIALSLVAGFMVAMGTALLIELLDRHVRDTEEMLSLYPLPILARIPKLPRRLAKSTRSAKEASPLSMPPAVREGFRTLLVQLQQRPNSKTIMVTSATSRDGKTTSAINLAYALVGAGHKVIIIDFDLRKPDIGVKLGAAAQRGLVSLLAEDTKLSDLLVPAAQLPTLKVVPAGTEGDVVLLEALTRRLPDLLKEAEELADYVILDTAPLGEVSDALRIADQVDDIIIVTRPGHTARANFQLMRDLLEQTGQTPLGFLVIGATPGTTSAYYAYGLPQRRDSGRSRFARSSLR
jgi:capsular exopolysaccharide synthesis family protein